MITPFMVYIVGIMDSCRDMLHSLFIGFVFLAVLTGFFFGMCCAERISGAGQLKKICIGCIITAIVCVVLHGLLPSTRMAAAMFVVPAVANNENMQAIGGNSLQALRKLTEQWLRELDAADGKGGKPGPNEERTEM
jgi:multisubunit Na+/H+ antiporter MnhE subunit